MHSAFIITYAQGLSLLNAASIEKNYDLNLQTTAKIWRGGCIIRAALLEQFRVAFYENPNLTNLLQDENISQILNKNIGHLRETVIFAASNGIPVGCFAASLSYFDAYTSRRLPANLIQAQRDFFGAHTYQRIDEEGTFHTDWNNEEAVQS